MFRKEQTEPPKPPISVGSSAPSTPVAKMETIIGPNAHFRGDIQSDGGVRIEGILEGTLDITGNLVIGEGAKVIADIKANNVSISGAVKGNIVGNRVEILETGRVWGDLTINSLLLNEGAYLRGQTTMHGDIQPPMIEPPKAQQPASPTKATIVDVEAKPTRVESE
ncbi:MAG: polymer-forming cytoskeletal protein [Anaerolineales bacterium]|nr:polymer-forming cytoskeletal protein [Anaerolineales bacterium]